jgi:hypothetical protein
VLFGPFYVNDVLLAPDLVQSLLSIRHFTTDNSCSIEFDPFGLSMKDLATSRVLARYDSTGPLYTLPLPTSTTPTRVLSRTPWLPLLPSPLGIIALVTLPPMSSPSCRVDQLSPVLGAEMIPCVMPASLVGTYGCPFLAPLLELFSPLTLYTVTFGPPLFRVCLVTSITWSSSMIAPTTRGLFCCARSPTPSPPFPTSSPLYPRSLTAPFGASSAILDMRLITPPALSSSLTASSFGCCVPTLPRRTTRSSA